VVGQLRVSELVFDQGLFAEECAFLWRERNLFRPEASETKSAKEPNATDRRLTRD
jgi:hypothetical protein